MISVDVGICARGVDTVQWAHYMKKTTVTVNTRTQHGYRYTRSEPVGKRFDPRFKPQLTPKEMLELGVFGGLYMDDKPKEYPRTWFAKAKLSTDGKRHKELNFFKVHASQPLSVWQKKGWIHAQDPRGWFEWYCRYYLGRRTADDERQIKRWLAIWRHAGAVQHNCMKGDLTCRPRQRQALLHWAIDARKI